MLRKKRKHSVLQTDSRGDSDVRDEVGKVGKAQDLIRS